VSPSPSMLDAFLATVVQLAGARAGTLHVPSSGGEPEFIASWERAQASGAIRVPSASVVLPLESGGQTLGLFTLHYDAPAGAARSRSPRPARARAGAARSALPESLTVREREILALLALGESNKAIARSLGISPDTVKLHVRHILAKLGCSSRVAAAVFAAQHGLGRERALPLAVS